VLMRVIWMSTTAVSFDDQHSPGTADRQRNGLVVFHGHRDTMCFRSGPREKILLVLSMKAGSRTPGLGGSLKLEKS